MGHPLENALLTGALIICLASRGSRWIAPSIRWPLLGLSLVAMVVRRDVARRDVARRDSGRS